VGTVTGTSRKVSADGDDDLYADREECRRDEDRDGNGEY